MGVSAHEAVFIFSTYLRGLFKSSVYNFFLKMHSSSLTNVAMFYLHSSTWKKIEFFHIFNLQCRLEQIFIFIFKLKLTSSNLPENPQGAPIIKQLIFFRQKNHVIRVVRP